MKPIYDVILTIATIIGGIAAITYFAKYLNNLEVILMIATIIGGIAATTYFFDTIINKLPRAYSIAVIGFPKSGKTTLITTLFGEFFAKRVLNVSTIPRGSATIGRVNADLSKLEIGEMVGPTTDQDLFAYRTDLIRGKFFKQRYKVEIGDFPGEDSQKFTEQFGDWFHKTPYFKWVMEADAFIFIVDIAQILGEKSAKQYSAKITQATRAAWQLLNEYHFEGNKNLRQKPVLVVFTKSDLFGITSHAIQEDAVLKKISQLGFEEIPEAKEIDPEKLKEGISYTEQLFSNLISYLNKESNQFNYLFVSCFSYSNNQKLGINELIEKILP
ncbi:GTPase domain-containing protein [Candidatus Parabeggiatoa sp. HSG14]|uniref:GTPase domain-containing protein n=1 Tax=Candidatus Parabeggiatoa sp. HSG14 TaxID=3055593 RepID=UPI0025A87EE1|nr:GTPase domain-containing protein [Thiotrichales bacterium HSG14]